MLKGEVYNHQQFPDGQVCSSDYIKEFKYGGDWIIAIGYSGRQYLAFNDKHHPTKKDVAV